MCLIYLNTLSFIIVENVDNRNKDEKTETTGYKVRNRGDRQRGGRGRGNRQDKDRLRFSDTGLLKSK